MSMVFINYRWTMVSRPPWRLSPSQKATGGKAQVWPIGPDSLILWNSSAQPGFLLGRPTGPSENLELLSQCVWELTHNLLPRARWLPTPIPPHPERKQLQAWPHIIWCANDGKEENFPEKVTPSMSHTLKQSFMTALGHLDQQSGPPKATSSLPQAGLRCPCP